jgi:hypothetical protein
VTNNQILSLGTAPRWRRSARGYCVPNDSKALIVLILVRGKVAPQDRGMQKWCRDAKRPRTVLRAPQESSGILRTIFHQNHELNHSVHQDRKAAVLEQLETNL